jgi:hypothetical protein
LPSQKAKSVKDVQRQSVKDVMQLNSFSRAATALFATRL